MNIFALVFILWIITVKDSVICRPLWTYQHQNPEYSETSNNEDLFNHRNLGLELNQWPANIPPSEFIYEESNLPYSPDANLRSFFIPSLPLSPIPHQVPVPYPNDWVSSQGSLDNYAGPVYESTTTSRSIKSRPSSTNMPRKMSTTSKVAYIEPGNKRSSISPRVIVESTTINRRYNRKISNPTMSSTRPEVSTESFVKKFHILNVKRKDSIFDIFKNQFHRKTSGTLELKSSTPGVLSEFVPSTPNSVPSSIITPTTESIDFRILNIEANDTEEMIEGPTDTIITKQSTSSNQIPIRSTIENKLENVTFKIDQGGVTIAPCVQINTNSRADPTTEAGTFEIISFVTQIPAENVTITSESGVIFQGTNKTPESSVTREINTIDYGSNSTNFTIGISNGQNQPPADILSTSSSIIQSSSPKMEIDNRKLTMDSNASEIIDREKFTTLATITTSPVYSKNTDELKFETTSMSSDNQSGFENLPASTTFSSNDAIDLIKIDHTDSTTKIPDLIGYTDTISTDVRKLIVDSNVSETIEPEQFTTSAMTTNTASILSKNTDELLETTSKSSDNQSVVDNLQLTSTFSSKNDATDLIEIDHTNFMTEVPDLVSYNDTISTENVRKLIIDSNASETIEQEQFTTPASISSKNTDELLETTSKSSENQSVVDNLQLASTFSSKNDATDLNEIDHTNFITEVPDLVSYNDTITDNVRKLIVDSNASETIEQEQFTTPASISSKNTYEFILETTSKSSDNQAIVDNFQLGSTFSSNADATDLIETIDHTDSTYVSDPVSYTDTIPSDSEVTVEDAIKFTCEYEPNETSTDYSYDRMEATSPQNFMEFNKSTSNLNGNEIEIRIKREEISTDSETTYSTETARFEVVIFTNMAKDSNNKFDIDRNDREEYIFNVPKSKSHVSKGSVV